MMRGGRYLLCLLLSLRLLLSKQYSCDLFAYLISFVQEDYDVGVKRLLQLICTLDDLLNQSEQAPFGVEPGISA